MGVHTQQWNREMTLSKIDNHTRDRLYVLYEYFLLLLPCEIVIDDKSDRINSSRSFYKFFIHDFHKLFDEIHLICVISSVFYLYITKEYREGSIIRPRDIPMSALIDDIIMQIQWLLDNKEADPLTILTVLGPQSENH